MRDPATEEDRSSSSSQGTIVLEAERMGYGSDAIGHLADGKVAFIEGAVPGDLVEVQVVDDKKRFARCRTVEVVEPSPSRVARPSGSPETIAPWAVMDYEAQLEAKLENVRSALSRTARIDPSHLDAILYPIAASPDTVGYRNKVEMSVGSDEGGRIELGFRDGRDRFVPFDGKRLSIAESVIQSAPRKLEGALRYIFGTDDHGIFRVGIRGSSRTGSIEVALWTRPSSFPRSFVAKVVGEAVGATSVVRVIADEGASRRVKRLEVLSGEGYWEEEMEGIGSFLVSAPSFFQVNTPQAAQLVEGAIGSISERLAEGICGSSIADLYSGVGTFSIPLAKRGADVVAIELAGSSARDLERDLPLNGIGRGDGPFVDVVCDDVEHGLEAFLDMDDAAVPCEGPFDAILVDPPRSGLTQRALSSIASAKAPIITYVSCDPQTLARDAARLAEAGYRLDLARPYDMFPQTWHVETLAVFSLDI